MAKPAEGEKNLRDTKGSATLHERFSVPGAEILSHDTWGEDRATCPSCGHEVTAGDSRCPECGQWLEHCSGSCPSCSSPRCVGDKREQRG